MPAVSHVVRYALTITAGLATLGDLDAVSSGHCGIKKYNTNVWLLTDYLCVIALLI